MAFYEIPAMFCIPLTAYICHQMAWSRNMQYNLIGEVLMISISYLMEDGPELLLQYFYVDKYSGKVEKLYSCDKKIKSLFKNCDGKF